MNRKKVIFLLLLVVGILIIIGIKVIPFQGPLLIFQRFAIVVGALLIGFGSSHLLFYKSLEDNKLKKKIEIQAGDERNIMIKEKASYWTVRTMNIIFMICAIITGIIIKSIDIVIVFIVLAVIQGIIFIVFSKYYGKKF